MTSTQHPGDVSERGKWMALLAAVLGWLFDGFEIGMFPLVGKPALAELLAGQDKAAAAPGRTKATEAKNKGKGGEEPAE